MVEIPPDGYKRMKNSRKMQMVFFVHEGKVTVDIEDVQFGMTKGGVWQVPRGEFFSFSFFFCFLCLHHCHLSLCLHIAKEQRSEMISSPQQCNRQAHARLDTHRLCSSVTPGNTCLCNNTNGCQNRVLSVAHLPVHPLIPCHSRGKKPGEPQYGRSMVLGLATLEDLWLVVANGFVLQKQA